MMSTLISFLSLFVVNHASNARNPVIDKPNIIFILADDLGWGNVGYHNKNNDEISTPNIDYLVENGLQLNRHYVDAECSPSRSSFQSGRLPVHVNTNNNDGILDSTMGIHPDMTCIATKLKEAGYSTHMVGKWDCGFASFRQIPINRGYDTYYGYLGKSIEYYSKKGDAICTKYYVDLWEDDHPAFDSIDEVDGESFVEYELLDRVLNTIDATASESEPDPLFIFYSSHLPHYPSQLPPDCIANGLYSEFSKDENLCTTGNLDDVSPEYTQDRDAWKCRSILQAQVAVLDDIVGQITDKLVENDLWENTLIVFSTDNGGSLEMDYTAGNNYPLRGGKATLLEGGVRATAFVSGGYLPEKRRGHLTNGLMHIADWYATFSEMLGIDSVDYDAMEKGLPAIDAMNMWPLISGETDVSPRSELILGKNVLIWDEWKIILGGTTRYAIWQGTHFPNETTPTQAELEQTYLKCDIKKNWGCLFNVEEDPGEHHDLADFHPQQVAKMRNRIAELKAGFWNSPFVGSNSCPVGYHDDGDGSDYISVDLVKYGLTADIASHACGCWMSQHNYNNFAGPFMDLPDEYIYFKEGRDESIDFVTSQSSSDDEESAVFILLDIGNLKDFKSNHIIYMALTIATVILLLFSCRNCKKTQERKKKKHELEKVASYGTVLVKR